MYFENAFFIRRTPQEYKAWIDGIKKECEIPFGL